MTSATIKSRPEESRSLDRETWSLLQQVVFSQRPRWIAVIREYDLVPPHWIALQTLDEPKPMGELAKQLACDNSNVTWITDRLEERGLVERRPAPHDRRVKLLVVTERGRRLREEIEARLAEPPPPIASLSREDQRTLRDILRRAAEHPDRRRGQEPSQSSNSA
ncbi:MAG TPA: MarR family transcriptional regulator [Solirubrobacterales bacterium]|nr:MarR family transcriptional regulator [Solirubrobacterales bacterium]